MNRTTNKQRNWDFLVYGIIQKNVSAGVPTGTEENSSPTKEHQVEVENQCRRRRELRERVCDTHMSTMEATISGSCTA